MSDLEFLHADGFAMDGVVHAFTTRAGGVSEGPYASLNLTWSRDDNKDHVAENRARVARALGLERLIFANQVHSARVIRVDGWPETWAAGDGDALITNVPGIPGMTPQYFAGALIRKVTPMVPIADGMAITHGITGIYDKLAVGVLADRGVMPDMDIYIQCLQDATDEYLQRARLLERASRMMEETAVIGEPAATLPASVRKAASGKRGNGRAKVKVVDVASTDIKEPLSAGADASPAAAKTE